MSLIHKRLFEHILPDMSCSGPQKNKSVY